MDIDEKLSKMENLHNQHPKLPGLAFTLWLADITHNCFEWTEIIQKDQTITRFRMIPR
jgi:hypothetical protein